MRFVARTGSGFELSMDNEAGGSGPRPTELLAVAVGGCTGMDVASILEKKRQAVTRYCSVSSGLATGIAELHHRYVVISPEGSAPVEGEAAVTGPGQVLPPDEA
jgi:organic hydroperoxide reductase OsmC/OhrA